jgi:NAD(P)-dependent dehydrogenase (short-subunit alcohol dehydrogenase family)
VRPGSDLPDSSDQPDPIPRARSVVITGVGRAGQVGDAVALAFAAEGDSVSLIARSIDDARARAAELTVKGFSAAAYACDLTDAAAIDAVARSIVSAAQGVDVLVNVAGGFAMSGPVATSDAAVLARQIAINVTTAYNATRAFLPAIREAGGAVVFFASAAALPGARVKEMSAYAIAKSGVVTLMRAVAQEERANGVRANAVAPTAIRTATNVESMPADAKYVEREAVAAVVRYLCSGDAANVTGQVFELAP